MKKIFLSLFAVAALAFSACASAMAPPGINALGFAQATATVASTQPVALAAATRVEQAKPSMLESKHSMLAQRMPTSVAIAFADLRPVPALKQIGILAEREAEGRTAETKAI